MEKKKTLRTMIDDPKNGNRTISNLTEQWHNMQNKTDLLNLLNGAIIQLYGENGRLISLQQLNYQAYSKNNPKRYISFQIPKKKKGEFRTIDAPCGGLKTIQQCLNVLFQSIYTPNISAMGFVPNRSVVDGATVHLQQRFVYNIDLKDFFPSITAGRLFKRLQSKPFGLNRELASLITDLCCHTNAVGCNVLPQGAPTSPTITNFICERMDRKLSKLAGAYGLKYSRYADDITFSGMTNVFAEDGRFCKSLKHIIEEEERFKINSDKTRLLHRGNRQEVTGITVNEKTNVSRSYIKQLRTLIHNWEVKGYNVAQNQFLEIYNKTNIKHQANTVHRIENIISGKLDYLKMVKGATDVTYKKLKCRFDSLITKEEKRETHKNEKKGIETPSISKEEFFEMMRLLVDSGNNNTTNKGVKNKLVQQYKPKRLKHDPEFISRFLHQFTEKECQALKFTTHRWDKDSKTHEYNYDSFDSFKTAYMRILNSTDKKLDQCQRDALYPSVIGKEKISLMDILHYRCEHLWQLIQNFLVNDESLYPWGEYKPMIKIGYNNDLKKWMNDNPHQQPFSMPLSVLDEELVPKKPINGKMLYDFGDVVELFKHSIEFRDDDLYKAVKRIFKSSDIHINEELLASLKGINIYTDTFLVKEALSIIAGNVHQRSEHPNLEIKCDTQTENGKEVISLEILQLDSFSYKETTDVKINPAIGKGDLFSIKDMLKNLCDFSVESLFKENNDIKPLRINYLSSNFDNYQDFESISEKECRGFKYILTFYKYDNENHNN